MTETLWSAVDTSYNYVGISGVVESAEPVTRELSREYIQRGDVFFLSPLPLPWRAFEVAKAAELGDLESPDFARWGPRDVPEWFSEEYPLLARIAGDGMNNFTVDAMLELADEFETAGADPRLGQSKRLALAGRAIRRAASRAARVRVPGR